VRKSLKWGVAVVGGFCACTSLSASASAGDYCGTRYYDGARYAPRADSYRFYRPAGRVGYYGGDYYRPRVLAWRTWGDPRWGPRSDWSWQRQWRREYGWSRW